MLHPLRHRCGGPGDQIATRGTAVVRTERVGVGGVGQEHRSGGKKELVHDLLRSMFREVQRYKEDGTRKTPYLMSAGSVNDRQNEAHQMRDSESPSERHHSKVQAGSRVQIPGLS